MLLENTTDVPVGAGLGAGWAALITWAPGHQLQLPAPGL